MSKDITKDILLKAGFEEIDRVDNVSITFELKKWDIEWDIESDWDITMPKFNQIEDMSDEKIIKDYL